MIISHHEKAMLGRHHHLQLKGDGPKVHFFGSHDWFVTKQKARL